MRDGSTATVTNTIFWNNDAAEGPEMWINGSMWNPSIVTISYSDVEGGQASAYVGTYGTLDWGAGMIDADPLFVDPANNDFHLTWDSPCRNSGDNDAPGCLAEDFEGDPCPALGIMDMGADEFWAHLYSTGNVVPGAGIEVKVVGGPDMPVLLGMGSGIQDPPQSTQHGDLYLGLPLAGYWSLPQVPGNGVLVYPATVPVSWNSGEQYPFQAAVGEWGGAETELTNLMVLEVE